MNNSWKNQLILKLDINNNQCVKYYSINNWWHKLNSPAFIVLDGDKE